MFVINDNTIDTFGIRFHNHTGDFSELLDNALIDTFDKSIIYDSNDYNFVTNILERANLKYKLNVALLYGKDPIENYLVIRHNLWNENITKENKKIVINEISSLYKNIISKYPIFEGKISNWKHSFLIRIDNHIEEALDIIRLIEINN